MMPDLNTSRAQRVTVDVFDYDDLPVSAAYTSESNPVDLTDYKFVFYLVNDKNVEKTYTINAGELSTDFLSKEGTDTNVLNMKNMFEDIRDSTEQQQYRIIQEVTDDSGKTYVHVIYTLNVQRY